MPPKASQKPSSSSKKGKSTSQKRTTLKLEPSAANTKRINPLTAFVNLPSSQGQPRASQSLSQTQPPSSLKVKTKGKSKEVYQEPSPTQSASELGVEGYDQLWVDMYEPQSEADLAVHVRKVENVRNWLNEAFDGGPSGKLRRYRRLLALTGPAGTAKTSTIRVLSREMDFEILEWRNTMGDILSHAQDYDNESSNSWVAEEGLFVKFQTFLQRASTCQNIFNTASTSNSKASSAHPRRIILLEELPNILHTNTRERFHDTIRSIITANESDPVPIVLILSDSGIRGEAGDERLASGAWGRDQDGAVDIRTVIPKDVLNGPYVFQIRYNPIAPTLLHKALQALLNKHFTAQKSPISKQLLDIVVDSANGDIRSATMALQFACIRLKKGKNGDAQVLMESITRREQSLALFHLIGKVLYNKRKGDPPSASASAKDVKKDQELDRRLKDPPALPSFLQEHERKASRVDVDIIYADSPIDSSLFSLYIHQNFTQFCADVDHCDGIADWLSWADSSGGEAWYQANPYRFHLLALGTLHSLPTPVPRRSQKVYKPEFFDNLVKEKDAWEGVRDVRSWIGRTSDWNIGAWTPQAIATELGAVLRARDNEGSNSRDRMPATHRKFSNLKFVYPKSGMAMSGEQLGETDGGEPHLDGVSAFEEQLDLGMWQEDHKDPETSRAEAGGWLESDDIEDF